MKKAPQEEPDPDRRKKRRVEKAEETSTDGEGRDRPGFEGEDGGENAGAGGNEGPPNPFVRLDDETFLRVLEHVGLYERMYVLSRVCRRFRTLAWEESECRRIYKRRFSAANSRGYRARLAFAARWYRREELTRDADASRLGVRLTHNFISARIADYAGVMGHDIVLRDVLSDIAADTEPFTYWNSLQRMTLSVLKRDDARCFEAILDSPLARDPRMWVAPAEENATEEEKPLLAAYRTASAGALNCLCVLERRGLDFRAVDPASRFHPLASAVGHGRAAVSEFLLERGIPLPVQRVRGEDELEIANPFSLAALSRDGDPVATLEVLRRNPPHAPYQLVADRSSNPTMQKWIGDAVEDALHVGTGPAFRYLFELELATALPNPHYDRDELIQMRLFGYVITEYEPFHGWTKLRALRDLGANLDAVEPSGSLTDANGESNECAATPLQTCLAEERYVVALQLLGIGANPNVGSEDLPVPLHLHVHRAADDPFGVYILRALLDRGADPRAKFEHAEHGLVNALELADRRGKANFASVLWDHVSSLGHPMDREQRT